MARLFGRRATSDADMPGALDAAHDNQADAGASVPYRDVGGYTADADEAGS